MEKEEVLLKLNEFKEKLNTLSRYSHISNVISYDMETVAPMKGSDEHQNDLMFIASLSHQLSHSKSFIDLIVLLNENLDLIDDVNDKKLISVYYEHYLQTKNITSKINAQLVEIYTKGYSSWLNAKNSDNFDLFKPVLKDIVKATFKELSLSEKPKLPTLLDDVMDNYEKGMTVELLDTFFQKLKESIIPLLKEISTKGKKYRTDFVNREVPEYKQIEFAKYLLKTIGYDMSKGALGLTEHPFTTSISEFDHRVTTNIDTSNFISSMYSILHEGGHGIFGQNVPKEAYDHHIDSQRSLAMDESVSRFFENRIGRSRSFIHLIYPEFRRIFKNEMYDVTEDDLYYAVNYVSPSLIRTEADELSYTLHIIIRYEIEKMLINEKLSVEKVKSVWNKKYKEYLGVTPLTDKDGVLQDVHWSSGFGYFPTYALGNAYNAMYYKKMDEDININQCILNNDIQKIVDYMKENIFAKACLLDGPTWIKDITGKDFSSDDYVEYLADKFTSIYLK